MLSAGEGIGTTGTERGIAALLLGVALAAGLMIPRLLSEPAGPHGIAIKASPGRVLVEAPPLAKTPRRTAVARAGSPVRVAAAPVVLVVAHTAPKLKPAPAKPVVSRPAAAPTTSSPGSPPPTPPSTPTTTPSISPPAIEPKILTAPKDAGRQNLSTGRGHNLRGFRHGPPVSKAAPHAVGAHHRGMGHLAPPPAGAAQTARTHGPEARSETGGRGGQRCQRGTSPTPAVTHGQGGRPADAGHGHGK
jgi:hypothetical protein